MAENNEIIIESSQILPSIMKQNPRTNNEEEDKDRYKDYDFISPLLNLFESNVPKFISLNALAFKDEEAIQDTHRWLFSLCNLRSDTFTRWDTVELRDLLLDNIDTLIESFRYSGGWPEDSRESELETYRLRGRIEAMNNYLLQEYAIGICSSTLHKMIDNYCNFYKGRVQEEAKKIKVKEDEQENKLLFGDSL